MAAENGAHHQAGVSYLVASGDETGLEEHCCMIFKSCDFPVQDRAAQPLHTFLFNTTK